ncbi:E3 ubiquitin-protein ligase MIEL1, partial [Sesamum angolense]
MEAPAANADVGRTQNHDDDNTSREDFGKLLYGCEHYRRRCKIRAPCCNQIFTCRHCHNEAASALSNPKESTRLFAMMLSKLFVRYAIQNNRFPISVQIAASNLENTSATYANSMMMISPKSSFIVMTAAFVDPESSWAYTSPHNILSVAGSCYSIGLRDNHLCVEDSMKSHCPICYEFLFDSTKQTTILKCGHTMHVECYEEMFSQNQYRCPICSKSVLNMSRTWERLDQEIEATAMPEEYRYEVQILCNDCNNRSKAFFHIFGHKCQH